MVSESGQLSDPARYAGLLRAFLVVDFAFIVVLLLPAPGSDHHDNPRRLVPPRPAGAAGARPVRRGGERAVPPGLLDQPGPVVVVATGLKWGALLLIIAVLVLSAVTSPSRQSDRSVASRLRRTGKAVMHQRFSFVPVVAMFILSVPSGAAILEQLPDALRGWISQGTVGARQAVLSMLCTLGLGAFLIMAGRYRTGYAFRHPKLDPPPPPEPDQELANLRVWAVGPLVALAGALLVMLTGHGEDILWLRLAVFLLVPIGVILGGSLIIRKVWKRPGNDRLYRYDTPPTFDDRELSAVRLAGMVAGLGAITVGGLSLIRAYVPLVILPRSTTMTESGLVWLILAIGATAVVAPWLVAMVVIPRIAARRSATSTPAGRSTGSPIAGPPSQSAVGFCCAARSRSSWCWASFRGSPHGSVWRAPPHWPWAAWPGCCPASPC